MLPKVNLFTDGSHNKKTDRGGFAGLLSCGHHKCMVFGLEEESSNNRMELFSVISGLAQLSVPCCVNVYSDSKYVVDAINRNWITNWVRNGWVTATRKPVANRDLWEMLLPYLSLHKVQMKWVKGHNGHFENEICDVIAGSESRYSDI